MSVRAMVGEVVPFSAEEVLLAGASNSLIGAFKTADRIRSVVEEDEAARGRAPTAQQLGRLMTEAGDWVSRRVERNGINRAEATAIGILAGAAHFFDVQHRLSRNRIMLSRSVRGVLTHTACSFNERIRRYGLEDPYGRSDDLMVAMAAMRWLTNPRANTIESENVFARAIRGQCHELAGTEVLRCGGEVKRATFRQDLMGVDVIWERIPIDLKASPVAVGWKCGTEPAPWGVNNGILVLWSGVYNDEMNGRLTIGPELSQRVYDRSIGEILLKAQSNPDIGRVKW